MLSKKLLIEIEIITAGLQLNAISSNIMRLPTISLLLLITASSSKTSTTSCDAFQSSLSIISHHHYRKATTATIATALSSSSNNNNDDSGWYDDYDDFVQKLDFENDSGWDSGADVPFDGSYDNAGNSRRGRGGGRGGRGSRGGRGGRGGRGSFNRGGNYGGGVGHDYQRDPNDFGSVDEGVVNDLLSQRLQFRKRKMFDEADNIRDDLLNVHGVTM